MLLQCLPRDQDYFAEYEELLLNLLPRLIDVASYDEVVLADHVLALSCLHYPDLDLTLDCLKCRF